MIFVNLFNLNFLSKKVCANDYKIYERVQTDIIEYLNNIIRNNFKYKIILHKNIHMVESDLPKLRSTDICIFHPHLTMNNLDIIKYIDKCITIIQKPTLLLQKISIFNPVNESMAIHNGFFINYILADSKDISNDNWKMIIDESLYLIDLEYMLKILSEDTNNVITEIKEKREIFKSLGELLNSNNFNNQINLNEND